MSADERRDFWRDKFEKCIKCYGCMDVCPVRVQSSTGLDLQKWVAGGQTPPPFPLFHLIRAYQVWDTCVGCGECERTCPAHIPLKTVQDIVRYLRPETAFEMIPGLEQAAREEIAAFVESKGPPEKTYYAI